MVAFLIITAMALHTLDDGRYFSEEERERERERERESERERERERQTDRQTDRQRAKAGEEDYFPHNFSLSHL